MSKYTLKYTYMNKWVSYPQERSYPINITSSQRASSRLWGSACMITFMAPTTEIVEETLFLHRDLKKILEVSFCTLESQIIFLVITELVKTLKLITVWGKHGRLEFWLCRPYTTKGEERWREEMFSITKNSSCLSSDPSGRHASLQRHQSLSLETCKLKEVL